MPPASSKLIGAAIVLAGTFTLGWRSSSILYERDSLKDVVAQQENAAETQRLVTRSITKGNSKYVEQIKGVSAMRDSLRSSLAASLSDYSQQQARSRADCQGGDAAPSEHTAMGAMDAGERRKAVDDAPAMMAEYAASAASVSASLSLCQNALTNLHNAGVIEIVSE